MSRSPRIYVGLAATVAFFAIGWWLLGPSQLGGPTSYAVLSGNSMEPAYRDGTVILISPAASIRRGDRVVVRTRDGEVMVKELKRRTAKTIELRSVNVEHQDRSLPVRDVEWIARVMWASQ